MQKKEHWHGSKRLFLPARSRPQTDWIGRWIVMGKIFTSFAGRVLTVAKRIEIIRHLFEL
jgi:hypothetical protein